MAEVFDPWTATLQEALLEGRRYHHEDEADLYNTRPVIQHVSVHRIRELQTAVEAGDSKALMECVHLCLESELIAPLWLADAFTAGFLKVASFAVASWDDAFSRPYAKGAHLKDLKRRTRMGLSVYFAVKREREAGHPVDRAMFERVGDELGIGRTLAEQLYYDNRDRLDRALS